MFSCALCPKHSVWEEEWIWRTEGKMKNLVISPQHVRKRATLQWQKSWLNGCFSHRKEKKKKIKKSNITAAKRPLCSMTFLPGSSTSGAWFSHGLNVAAALQWCRCNACQGCGAAPCRPAAGTAVSLCTPGPLGALQTLPLQLLELLLCGLIDLLDLEVQTWKPERGRMPWARCWGRVLRGQTAGGWPQEDDKWGTRCPPLIPERSQPLWSYGSHWRWRKASCEQGF